MMLGRTIEGGGKVSHFSARLVCVVGYKENKGSLLFRAFQYGEEMSCRRSWGGSKG